MKIALIHGKFWNSWEALGLGYLAAYTRKHLPGVDLRFFQGCFDSDEDILAGSVDADVVGFSCTSPAMAHSLSLARALKAQNPKAVTVFGGYHPSAVPEETAALAGVDCVVVGPGEEAFLKVLAGDRSRVIRAMPRGIPKVWPDRETIKSERNIEVAQRDTGKRITSFQSRRGCPFSCKFCADGQKVMYGRQISDREIGDLLDEIETVTARYQLDYFKFNDGTFNVRPELVRYFCTQKVRRGNRTPWFANLHAHRALTPEPLFESLASAACDTVGIGIESGSAKVLKAIGKGTTPAMVRRAVALAKRMGLRVRGYFCIGTPTETAEDLRRTEAFAEELNLDEYGFSILCPYPGSLYYAERRNDFAGIDWSETDEYRNDFWRTANLSNEDLKGWQDRLVAKFAQHLTQRQRDAPVKEPARCS